MRANRLTAILLALPLALGSIAAHEGDGEVHLYGPCSNPAGTVVTPAAGFNGVVPTPIGAIFSVETQDAGTYTVSLEGLAEGTTTTLDLELSWSPTGDVGDYDLVINGTNDLSVESPERHAEPAHHCQVFQLETDVFIGTPIDTLTLDVAVR